MHDISLRMCRVGPRARAHRVAMCMRMAKTCTCAWLLTAQVYYWQSCDPEMPSTPQHDIAFEPSHVGQGPAPARSDQTKLRDIVRPEDRRPYVEDLDFPRTSVLPKIRNNNEQPVVMRINSAGVASPNKSPNAKSPENEERKTAFVGSSPKKAPPAKGGGPPKSKQVGWGSKKVSPDGSQIQLKPDDNVQQKPEVSSPSPDKENDRSSEKKASYPDVWIPNNNGTLEELAASARPPIFFEMDKIQKSNQHDSLLDEELITEELKMEERAERSEMMMEVGLFTVKREVASKGEVGGWQWTRTGFNPDLGLAVVKAAHQREYLVASRVHGAEIMVARSHKDFSQLHRALQTR